MLTPDPATQFPPYRPLFPYPFCCLCYEPLHPGHHGWDVCHECAMYDMAPEDISCGCYLAMEGPVGGYTMKPWNPEIPAPRGNQLSQGENDDLPD